MSNEDKIQEKAIQFQILQNNLRGLQQREQMLIDGLEELSRAKIALEDIKNFKGDAYIPLGGNNFVKGKVEDTENILLAVGGGIAVKKKREEALKMLEENADKYRKEANKVINEIKKINDQLMQIQSEVESLRK